MIIMIDVNPDDIKNSHFRPVNDNRASLLSRSPALPRKPEKERDGYMQVWKYYMTMAYLVVPAVPSPVIRCASPDLSLR